MHPQLQRAMAQLARTAPNGSLSQDQFEAALLEARYTGPVVQHWFNGKLQRVDLGSPVQLSIVEADRS